MIFSNRLKICEIVLKNSPHYNAYEFAHLTETGLFLHFEIPTFDHPPCTSASSNLIFCSTSMQCYDYTVSDKSDVINLILDVGKYLVDQQLIILKSFFWKMYEWSRHNEGIIMGEIWTIGLAKNLMTISLLFLFFLWLSFK